uniref:Uncharacterized protein n=1 Tax=Anguilla anguilla TaxID=7936 RepID=A0A0E9VD00_ANGAN
MEQVLNLFHFVSEYGILFQQSLAHAFVGHSISTKHKN